MTFRSLQYKILAVISFVLLTCLSIYVWIAIETFKKDKTEVIYDVNQRTIQSLVAEINNGLSSSGNTFRLFAQSYSYFGKDKATKLFSEILVKDPLIVTMGLFEKTSDGKVTKQVSLSNKTYFQLTHTKESDVDDELSKYVFSASPKMELKSEILWSPKVQNLPLLGYGINVIQHNLSNNTDSHIYLVGFLRSDIFFNVNQRELTKTFLIDKSGKILLSSNGELNESNGTLSNPLINQFMQGISRNSVMKFSDDTGKEFFGAFSTLNFSDFAVVSMIEAQPAFAGVNKLVFRSLIFALAILCFGFIVSLFFSKTITNPILALVETMKKISKGDLSQRATTKSKDEIGELTNVFNQMTSDLKASHDGLEELNRSLEEKVKDRTRQLEELATRDPLTNLFNRRHFNAKLLEEINRSKRSKNPVSVVYLDIDHFKKYNDGNGHPQGDILLKQFSLVIQTPIRNTDTCARLGGEGFCIILPETDLKGALLCAEKVRKAVESTDFPNGEKQPLGRVTCSLGVSEFPTFGHDEESLIQSADKALYHVKESGRNQVGAPRATI
jgi:diguanylate cyclase (GGDEF)-like protein